MSHFGRFQGVFVYGPGSWPGWESKSGPGVDVAVPGVERGSDGVAGLVGRGLEDPETERWHLDAVVEGDGFHVFALSGDLSRRCGGEVANPHVLLGPAIRWV